ncbi:MAG TPA: Hsp20/alpha crystallin family protein [Spirochaetota bacterium]|nr:Hsp20/alpha crystallin family protein [Spirochaetota bacterium]HQO40823.1 Hsp20/alpha crystallin family protein [Spirochaetota bacterium]
MIERNVTYANGEQKKVYIPLTDICETPDNYSLKMEVPGAARENIDIVIEDDELRVTVKSADEETEDTLKYSEFGTRDFYRAFRVGNEIDRNKIEAKLENGVLNILLSKTEKVKPKKIQITHN